MIEVPTPSGPARIHPAPVDEARAVLLLGHSAGGGVDDRALLAARDGAATVGVSTVLVELPYRVAGSKRPSPPAQADAAWVAVVEHLRGHVPDLVLVAGGRSYGGRVACRTSVAAGAVGVVCLAFPMVPVVGGRVAREGRAGVSRPGSAPPSRLPELDGVTVPTLVVQGDRDPYGLPPAAPAREVVVLRGDHSLRTCLPDVSAAVSAWLDRLLAGP